MNILRGSCLPRWYESTDAIVNMRIRQCVEQCSDGMGEGSNHDAGQRNCETTPKYNADALCLGKICIRDHPYAQFMQQQGAGDRDWTRGWCGLLRATREAG